MTKKPSKSAVEGHSAAQTEKIAEEYPKDKSGAYTPFILQTLSELNKNLEQVKYGEVSFSAKIHEGRIVAICHSKTENRIEKATQGAAI
jgi:hypothetical protein